MDFNNPNHWTNSYLLRGFNPVIRWLIVSDIVLFGSAGILAPIFAVFVTDYVPGGNIQAAGVAVAIYLLTKSFAQIPISAVMDTVKGEKDDYKFLIIGSFGLAIVPLLYIFVTNINQLFFVQFLNGLVAAAALPSYMAIFTRHVEKNKESLAWGVYFTFYDLSTAAAGAIGGTLAYHIGFKWVFVLVSALSIIGSMILILIKKYMRPVIKPEEIKIQEAIK